MSSRDEDRAEYAGALHLHPLSKILQMRTALTYLDDFDEKNRSRRGRKDEDDGEEKEDKKSQQAAQGPPIKALRKVSYQYYSLLSGA